MHTCSSYKKEHPWRVILAAALFFLFEYINMNSFNALNQELRQDFQVNVLDISHLSAMYFYANTLFLIPAGILLDRFSTRKLIIFGMSISIAATFIFAGTHSFKTAMICRFVTGFASTFCLLSGAVLTSRWFKSDKAALVMGVVIAMPMLGGILAQQIVFVSQALGSWRSAIQGVGYLGLIFLVLIWKYVQDYPAQYQMQLWEQGEKIKDMNFVKSISLAFKNKQVWFCGLYAHCLCLPIFILGALWGQDYLRVAHQLDPNQASFASSLIFVGMLIGSPLNGWLSDKMGYRRWPMLIGSLLTLITMLTILYEHGTPDIEYALFFALGFFSSCQVITYAVLMESSPSHITASTESVAAMMIMCSGAIFQPLFGYLLQQGWDGRMLNGLAVYTAHDYRQALLILPIAFVVSTIMALVIRETYCERLQLEFHVTETEEPSRHGPI